MELVVDIGSDIYCEHATLLMPIEVMVHIICIYMTRSVAPLMWELVSSRLRESGETMLDRRGYYDI